MNRREAMNRRRGWSFLVVTQPSTGQQLLCVRCVSVCTASSVNYYCGLSWYQGNVLPVITADITGHSKFCDATHTTLNSSVPEIRNFFQTAVTHSL